MAEPSQLAAALGYTGRRDSLRNAYLNPFDASAQPDPTLEGLGEQWQGVRKGVHEAMGGEQAPNKMMTDADMYARILGAGGGPQGVAQYMSEQGVDPVVANSAIGATNNIGKMGAKALAAAAAKAPPAKPFVPGAEAALVKGSPEWKTAALAEPLPILPGDMRVSTRLPTAVKKAEDPLTHHLNIGQAEVVASPTFERNAGLLGEYPGFAKLRGLPPEAAAEGYVDQAAGNLEFIRKNSPKVMQDRSPLWYDGAHEFMGNLAQRYGIPRQSASAAGANLSPQQDWFQNASLTERVGDVIFGAGASKKMSSEMNAMVDRLVERSPNLGRTLPAIKGKSFSQMETPEQQAMWIRIYDESHNPSHFRSMTPEGELGGFVLNADGAPSKLRWGSTVEGSKAVQSFLSGGDMNKISPLLGEKHKVRSFYNNIEVPNDARFADVTADTHQVAAAQLRPLSAISPAVAHNFGSSLEVKHQPPGWIAAQNSSKDGVQGTYGLTAEATRRAADSEGLLARSMQSGTWEPVRELFTSGFKTPKNNAMIDAIWRAHDAGEISLDTARKAVLEAAGGIGTPSWARPNSQADGGRAISTYR